MKRSCSRKKVKVRNIPIGHPCCPFGGVDLCVDSKHAIICNGAPGSRGLPGPSNLVLPTGQTFIGIVQGQINSETGEILHGKGFTTFVIAPGNVRVTLTDPALINPTVTASPDNNAFDVMVINQDANQFELFSGFGKLNFIAMGPCPPSTNPP